MALPYINFLARPAVQCGIYTVAGWWVAARTVDSLRNKGYTLEKHEVISTPNVYLMSTIVTVCLWAVHPFIAAIALGIGYYARGFIPPKTTFFPDEFEKLNLANFTFPSHVKVIVGSGYFFLKSNVSLPQKLDVDGTLFINARDWSSLPSGLNLTGNLVVSQCANLTSLPEDLRVEGNLYISNCPNLRSLPSWITTLGFQSNGNLRIIKLEGTGLSEETLNHLRAAEHPGIQFHFSQRARVPARQFSSLGAALSFWLEKAEKPSLALPNIMIDVHIDKVLDFLSRLTSTAEYKNSKTQPFLAQRIIEAFQAMAQDDEINRMAIDIIYRGLQTCDDGVISLLDQIELMVRIAKIESSPCSEEELRALGKSYLLLEMVDQKAKEFIYTLGWVDEVEVFLAYHIGLADHFNLPIATRNMIFSNMSQVTDVQIDAARQAIEHDCTEEKIEEYLQAWSPWQRHQRRRSVPHYETLPLTKGYALNPDEVCLITQNAPSKPVLYLGKVYEYDAFIRWYIEKGTDPSNRSKIDLTNLQQISK